jgi:hypothetical protein
MLAGHPTGSAARRLAGRVSPAGCGCGGGGCGNHQSALVEAEKLLQQLDRTVRVDLSARPRRVYVGLVPLNVVELAEGEGVRQGANNS